MRVRLDPWQAQHHLLLFGSTFCLAACLSVCLFLCSSLCLSAFLFVRRSSPTFKFGTLEVNGCHSLRTRPRDSQRQQICYGRLWMHNRNVLVFQESFRLRQFHTISSFQILLDSWITKPLRKPLRFFSLWWGYGFLRSQKTFVSTVVRASRHLLKMMPSKVDPL